jgi:uncharacterized protein YlzI (FlbEa/FlbD family)
MKGVITLTRPDGSRIVLNTAHILSLAMAPAGAVAGPPGARTRITFANNAHQDVQETAEEVLAAWEAIVEP